jgi:hypothetical protein
MIISTAGYSHISSSHQGGTKGGIWSHRRQQPWRMECLHTYRWRHEPCSTSQEPEGPRDKILVTLAAGIFRNVVEQYLHVICPRFHRWVLARFLLVHFKMMRCSFAGDDDLANTVGEHVGDIAIRQGTEQMDSKEDLQLPNNNFSLFTFYNTQPSMSSTSNVVFPPYTKALLDGLVRKREFPRGDEVMLYAPWPIWSSIQCPQVQRAFLKATLGDRFSTK